MDVQYHELPNIKEITRIDLRFSRSLALCDAVDRDKFFSFIGSFQGESTSGRQLVEIIIVDVYCDRVPPLNSVGINYPERLALCVPEDSKTLIEVLALRSDFPKLIHQNYVPQGSAPSLCLYNEAPLSVARTWTATSFLNRIQFWLEHSARGTLHGADQPPEQLFFNSPYELILPWNFEELLGNPSNKYCILEIRTRPDGKTLFLGDSSQAKDSNIPTTGTISVVNFNLTAILHGQIEFDFDTLGHIADNLLARNLDMIEALTQEIYCRVGSGIPIGNDDVGTVIMMHIPIKTNESEPPQRTVHRAYLLEDGILKLGEKLGVIFTSLPEANKERYYYRDQPIGPNDHHVQTEWRNEPVFPMEILKCIDRQAARAQSGIDSEGFQGTLIGVGALGSAMLDMLTRSGWGEWTVIDKDHIKPHNLVRHQADASMIGMPKAIAAQYHTNLVMQGASNCNAIHADACNLSEIKVMEALRLSKLIIDASTTLEYPRISSTLDDIGRHLSAFVTSDGNASVLLLEDTLRKKRLRTLEAQYYRGIISNEWGRTHLKSSLGLYRSGASCGDISSVMPYFKILGHAATLVEQITYLSSLDDAVIRIWSKDVATGAVSIQNIDAEEELKFILPNLDVFLDKGIQDRLFSFRKSYLPAETGGILVGYHDFNINAVVIVDALPAPSDSVSSSVSFERGLNGVIDAVAEANKRTSGIVGYIGEWHSHPTGCSTSPSSSDNSQLAYLAQGLLAEEGVPAIMLIVGDGDIRPIIRNTYEPSF